MKELRLGIIGGGLMGREMAGVGARWFAFADMPVKLRVVAVSDNNQDPLNWFRQVPGINKFYPDYRELLADAEVDAVYIAVPHHLHETVYSDCLRAGKDLLAEKPFGIYAGAAELLTALISSTGRFVRVSSEFPFLPGPQAIVAQARAGTFGKLLEVKAGFLHSSDLDPNKPINWKRRAETCGELGVLGDLGLHATHVPLRLGWNPNSVYARLTKVYAQRPDGKGGFAACDTWDNATLATWFESQGERVPMTLEMKRVAPGEANTWYLEVLGTEGGARYSTKEPKTLWNFSAKEGQSWARRDLGFNGPFPTITGAIFEPGFPDALMQMTAAFALERAGLLGQKFGCATPREALLSHQLFAAALKSQNANSVFPVT